MKEFLSQVVESILNGNHDDAKEAFSNYISEKTTDILSERYGDSDFEEEVYNWVMNYEPYYIEAKQLKADGANYDKWQDLVQRIANDHNIYPEGEDDVYDTVQGLMRDNEMLGEKTSSPQDPEIKDRKGTQPKKYYKGIKSKSTKEARDAHFKKHAKMDDDNPKAYKKAPGDASAKTKESKHTKKFKQMYGEGEQVITEKNVESSLKKKAEKSGMPYGILKKVYDRGVAAWRTGHRPGTTPSQWGLARVNSFTTKSSGTWGKADKDLAKKVRANEEYLGESLRNMSDVDFLYQSIMKTPTYYDDMMVVDVDGHDSDWKPFILNVADDSGISVDDETIQNLTQKLKAYTAMDNSKKKRPRWVNESDNKKDRNFVAKHMNKVNRPQTHRDKKNDYKRKPKHKKRLDEDFDPHKMIMHVYRKTDKHSGYVSQGMDKEDKFRRAKKVVDHIAQKEGLNMSVEDKHMTARFIANKEG